MIGPEGRLGHLEVAGDGGGEGGDVEVLQPADEPVGRQDLQPVILHRDDGPRGGGRGATGSGILVVATDGVYSILTASGSTVENPPAGYYKVPSLGSLPPGVELDNVRADSRAGMTLGHIGHLVQVPRSEAAGAAGAIR